MIVFDVPAWQLVQFVIAVVLPVLVGLATTRATDPGLKAALLLGLSLVSSLLTELLAAMQTGQTYNLGLALLLALGSFVVGVAMHYGLYKPAGISDVAADHLNTSRASGGYLPAGSPVGAAGATFVRHNRAEPDSVLTREEWDAVRAKVDGPEDDDPPKHRAEPAP